MTPENNSTPPDHIPNASENFGKVPNDAESFRTVPNVSERKEDHTLTVREVARMFEAAGVARTERSITNWCQPNKSGIARLDAYFDPNERRYFLTPRSAELAIQEEKAKAVKGGVPSEPIGSVPKDAEEAQNKTTPVVEDAEQVKELEKEVFDLKITNRGKDYYIEQLQKEREGFALERQGYVEKLVNASRMVGELETKLLQLGAPPKIVNDPLLREEAN